MAVRARRSVAVTSTLVLALGLSLGSAMAASAAPVVTFADLQAAFATSGPVGLTAPIAAPTDELDLTSGTTVTLDLAGQSLSVHTIQLAAGSQLTVVDSSPGKTGTLTADASDIPIGPYADARAGIMVPATAKLVVTSGTITAKGGGQGASGIGAQSHGGLGATLGTVEIDGGTVNATGSLSGAGIGSAAVMSGGTVIITAGTVTATGGYAASGIGGGFLSAIDSISISGGDVTATGGDLAAGIGGGESAGGVFVGSADISISGGNVTATGGNLAAGIGSGESGTTGGSIAITGGTVTAVGGNNGAAIGGGSHSAGPTIAISGGTVDARSDIGAGIGSGANGGANSTITISGTANITANATSGAAIGSGFGSDAGPIAISGGTVAATATGGAAAIGGGISGGIASITISGGTVVARSTTLAPAIGRGINGGATGTIAIGNGADVTAGTDQNITALGGGDSMVITVDGILRVPADSLLAAPASGFTIGSTGSILGAGEFSGAATVTNNGIIALPTVSATDVQVHNYLVTFAPSVPGGSDGSSVRVYATTFTAGVRTLAPDPTRAGFAFAGWSTQADGSGAPFTASSTITADLTVYPTWTAVPVTPGSGSTPSDTGIGATTATGATLASTGLDATPALIVGSILSVLGLAGIYLRRRLAVTGR